MDFTHAVVEQLGHRRFVGRVTEVAIAGATMLKVETADALTEDGAVVYAQPIYLGGGSIFALRPTTEDAIQGELRRAAEARRLEEEQRRRWLESHSLPATPTGARCNDGEHDWDEDGDCRRCEATRCQYGDPNSTDYMCAGASVEDEILCLEHLNLEGGAGAQRARGLSDEP